MTAAPHDLDPVETKQNVNTWRLDVRVDHTDTLPFGRQEESHVGSDIGFARAAPERVDGYDLGQSMPSFP